MQLSFIFLPDNSKCLPECKPTVYRKIISLIKTGDEI